MEWTYDRESGQVLGLTRSEVVALSKELQPQINALRKKVDHYRDIHEGGDATEKQQDLMFEYETRLNFLIALSNQAK